MKPLHYLSMIAALNIFLVIGCTDDEIRVYQAEPELPASPLNYSEPEVSSGFFINTQLFNVTDEGATLGRVLFYDRILSRNNGVACASCHLQKHGFADTNPFSSGINGQVLDRNTPALVNLYDDNLLFWDGRAKSLEELVLKPVRNHKEMGLNDSEFLLAKLNKAPYYAPLFEEAFGTPDITQERVADALAQFLSSMITARSKFDRVNSGEDSFTQLEELGQQVFFGEGRCYNCHLGPDFNQRFGGFGGPGWEFNQANIGLDEEYADKGMGELNPDQAGEFKIPSLRNVAMTAPYMHDGRFATLEEVIDHYNTGIQDHPNLAFELRDWQTGGPARLGLDPTQKTALVRFLETLSDQQYVTDPKFSDPFTH